MNKNMKYIIPVISIVVIGIIIILIVNGINSNKIILEYTYSDEGTATTKYEIKLKNNKELYVKEISNCVVVNCESKTKENKIKINDSEKEKISKIISKDNYDKKILSTALSAIVRNSEVMAKKEAYASTWDITYKDADKDSDGVVTYREFGDSFLDIIINNQ